MILSEVSGIIEERGLKRNRELEFGLCKRKTEEEGYLPHTPLFCCRWCPLVRHWFWTSLDISYHCLGCSGCSNSSYWASQAAPGRAGWYHSWAMSRCLLWRDTAGKPIGVQTFWAGLLKGNENVTYTTDVFIGTTTNLPHMWDVDREASRFLLHA